MKNSLADEMFKLVYLIWILIFNNQIEINDNSNDNDIVKAVSVFLF